MPAQVPGTAAVALKRDDYDAEDFTFRTAFEAEAAADGETVLLHLDGVATIATVMLNGEQILESRSMFAQHAVDVSTLMRDGRNELEIRCFALAPLLAERRKPRARWRTRVAANGNLRFFRTTLVGRAPGFANGPAPVGPWRPVWLERRRGVALDSLSLVPRIEGDDGVLAIRVGATGPVEVELSGPSGTHSTTTVSGAAGLRVPGVARWWPHTHGEPVLHDVRISADGGLLAARRVGFRTLESSGDVERDGLDLHVNGVRVFARGAVWTAIDPVGLTGTVAELRAAVEQAAAAGMNVLRVPGTGVYESQGFHDLCDELGVLVWQDMMYANLDYPFADADFRALAEDEARAVLGEIAGRPSLAVVGGNSEVEQQVAMLGLDPALGRGEFFGETLPALVRESGADAVYVPSSPCGGELPFRPGTGIANYYGVGAYLRPLDDARRSGVRFAAECLAFANVPDDTRGLVAHDPRWKKGVPRDVGAGWDFDDVRDHYLETLFGIDPVALRWVDHDRYLELSRAVSGEVMAEVFGEWRRTASPSRGGIVLCLRDLAPGAGWGVVDSSGAPKVAYHHLRRALAPVAVWTVDEGLSGVKVHVANDRPQPLRVRLRVALYRDREQCVGDAFDELEVEPHAGAERDVEALIGHFVDAAAAYAFGTPAQDAIVASLELAGDDAGGGAELVAQAFRFPAGRPIDAETPARLGLSADVEPAADGALTLTVRSVRLAYGVRIDLPGYERSDDAFSVEPGGSRSIRLWPRRGESGQDERTGALTALNMQGRVPFKLPADS